MRREFLQLAEKYKPGKDNLAGWFVSEKLDGTRCFWDGGLSRGVPTAQVPWASILDPETGKRKAKVKPVATGLWSRYGNPIIAPDEFLNLLPCCPLDGELWAGRGNFQLCRSICGGDTPDPRFMDQIVYAVYSSPSRASVFGDGEIKNANMLHAMNYDACEAWINEPEDYVQLPPRATFAEEASFLAANLDNGPGSKCYLHRQTKLFDIPEEAAAQVEAFLVRVLDQGGEGVVIRDPQATWVPKRHRQILKYKPYKDSEATVVGFTSGRETLKGSRLRGMIGALVCKWHGKLFELAGLTDVEREFATQGMSDYADQYPGACMPPHYQGRCFKVGDQVTFKYREVSDDGLPKEARYYRKRDVE